MSISKELLETPEELERKQVHEVYQEIAGHFSYTRYKPWPRVQQFVESLPNGALILDVGCGNGKYLTLRPLTSIGSDMCLELINICRERKLEAHGGDMLNLPYRPGVADGCVCIAAVHHLCTLDRRRAAIEEIHRVLANGGRALIYVWALEQQNRQFESQDELVPWKLPRKFTKGDASDASSKGGEHDIAATYERYYHLFREGELEELITSVPGMEIECSGYDRDNWWVVTKRVN